MQTRGLFSAFNRGKTRLKCNFRCKISTSVFLRVTTLHHLARVLWTLVVVGERSRASVSHATQSVEEEADILVAPMAKFANPGSLCKLGDARAIAKAFEPCMLLLVVP